MRRIALLTALIVGAGSALAASAMGDNTYKYYLEFDNAFGIVSGSEVKVAGVAQGTVTDLDINPDKRAVLEVEMSGPLAQLGEKTICSSEPQSLIAEYFVDCLPKGPPLEEGEGTKEERINDPDVPVEQTRQTVQNDLVQSGLRQPFKDRLRLIINEFGTALAGNADNLNAAIRRGAPALTSARKVTKVLGDQNTIIRNLNVNSDRVIGKLNERRKDVVSFIENAGDTAEASAERRDDLSADFRDLDDFLAELRPTMVRLNELAVTQTPLLRDLRRAGPGLNTLSRNLPDFNAAGTKSLTTLGDASVVGERALRKGANEIRQLKVSSKKAFSAGDHLAKFLRDIDDPNRAVEEDTRAAEDTGRKFPTGYTGMEGLLNYVYYQPGALNQFDSISHLLHFSIFEVAEGPCSSYNAGTTVPSSSGGETKNFNEINRCVAWLGDNQPGINSGPQLPPYDPSVCPEGSSDEELCDPDGSGSATAASSTRSAAKAPQGGSGDEEGAADSTQGGEGEPQLPAELEQALQLPTAPGAEAGGARGQNGKGNRPGRQNRPGRPGANDSSGDATGDLLGFLLDN